MGVSVRSLASHVKKYLLLYSILAILIGIAIGYAYRGWFSANKSLVSNSIIALAILTIYPSMVQLKVEKLGAAAKKIREIALSMVLIFLVSPLLAIVFSFLLENRNVALGYVVSNVVPASSASIGYVLLSGGDIELATMLAVLSLAGSLVAIPAYLGAYASAMSVSLPMGDVMSALIYTLVTPFVLGQLTRYLLVSRRAKNLAKKGALARAEGIREDSGQKRAEDAKGDGMVRVEEELKKAEKELKKIEEKFIKELDSLMQPHLSLATMVTMLLLIAMLGASRAGLIVSKPVMALMIIGIQAVMLFILLGIVTLVDRLMKVGYEENGAITFISATKNQSLAAAIAVMALGPEAAIVPALIPAIQAPVAIVYVHLSPHLKRLFKA